MADGAKSDIIGNIRIIDKVVKEKKPSIQALIVTYKKYLEDSLSALAQRKEQLIRAEQERAERLLEQEQVAREAAEAISAAKETASQEAAPAKDATEVKEAAETKKVPEEKSAASEEAATAVQPESKPNEAEKETVRPALSESLQKIAQAYASTILAPENKPAIEKPKIRVYIPPVEQPRRTPNQGGGRPGGYPPRTQGGTGTGTGSYAGRSTNLKSVVMNTAPVASKDATRKGIKNDKPAPAAAATDRGGLKTNKKRAVRMGFDENISEIEYDETTGEIKKIRIRRTGDKRKGFNLTETAIIDRAVVNKKNFTVKELSEKIGKTGAEIIKKLFILGIIKTINDSIDFETAELVSTELGVVLELQATETNEEKLLAYHDTVEEEKSEDLVPRPPVVTIMGHVDHGKTSILDYIRKSNVAMGEAGGITQHIGAYSTVVNGSPITFLDTPGHEAFTAMRARGANVTDIVIIVVAADDGIMPQTIEAINHSKAARVPIIVAINKIDRSGADPDRIMTQLTQYELVPEEWGGTTPCVKVSAKTGEGIDNLLETILITAEVMELKANPKREAKGTIIEAQLDKGRGPVATVLVQNGTLKIGDYIVAGVSEGKVKAMQDDKGRMVKKVGPSTAVSILGLREVPSAGDQLLALKDEKLLKAVIEERIAKDRLSLQSSGKVSLDDVFKDIAQGKLKNLNLIIKADVQGSVEAIKDSMLKLSNEEVKVSVIHGNAGAINEGDVMLADTTNAIIIGFNVRPDSKAKALAEDKKIDIRFYRVIYDAIDDVSAAIKGLLSPKFREQYLGKAEVRVIYKIPGVGNIAGSMVKDGKIVRNAKVRLVRNNVVIADTAISSLKRMKDDVKEVAAGYECGIGLENFNDIMEGDIIESFEVVKI